MHNCDLQQGRQRESSPQNRIGEKMPEGARATDDPEAIVVQIVPHATVEELAEGEAATAEPELIRREKTGEEAGE